MGAIAGCAISYPLGQLIKNVAEVAPLNKDGSHPYNRNYRTVFREIWYSQDTGQHYRGFSKTYFWRTAPWMFISGWIADDFGLFSHWKHTRHTGTGNNTHDDLRH